MNFNNILPLKRLLLESPIWDDSISTLWFISIFSPSELNSYCPADNQSKSWDLPEVIGCIALTSNQNKILLALTSRIALFDTLDGRLETFMSLSHNPSSMRMNDGRVDRMGRFWVGSMTAVNDYSIKHGELYCISGNGESHVMRKDFMIPNSTAFSPDGQTMYWSDSKTRKILRFDLNKESGVLSNERVFVDFNIDGSPGDPDGATCDSEGIFLRSFN